MNFYDILFQQQNAEKVPYSKSYFDTLFAQKFSNIKTLTGTLPLTFTTSETKLRSWTIYGADIEHEKTATGNSISFYTDESKLRDWVIYGNENGVGERTPNFIDLSQTPSLITEDISFIVDAAKGTITINGTNTGGSDINYRIEGFTPPSPGEYNFAGCPEGGTSDSYYILPYDVAAGALFRKWNGTTACGNDFGGEPREILMRADSKPRFTIRIKSGYTAHNLVFKPMLWLGSLGEDAEFIPYGYQIPLLVNDTETDIFVGSDPLTAGESVSKTSTGVDIATTDGNNAITTSLYNQPDMSITYNEFTGVGLFVGNLFIIALQLKAGGSTLNVFNITLNKPLRAGETLTSEQTGETIQTVAGVENKLSPSPKAASYGGSFAMTIKYKE